MLLFGEDRKNSQHKGHEGTLRGVGRRHPEGHREGEVRLRAHVPACASPAPDAGRCTALVPVVLAQAGTRAAQCRQWQR
jgi:hypothetical protein